MKRPGPSPQHILTLLAILITLAAPTAVKSLPPAAPHAPLATQNLWIDMLIGPPLVPLFNEFARDDDIAHVDQPQQMEQFTGIEKGQTMLIFRSVADTEDQLPKLAERLDLVGYNLEHSPATPAHEQNDPVGSIRRMRELADAHEIALALGPDHDFALSHGAAMAPYVDIFVLQIQRQQTNPPVVLDFVSGLVPQLRAANPELQISVQVRTEGDMDALVALIEELQPYINGVSILTSPQTVDVAEDLVRRLRGTAVYLPMVRSCG